MTTDAFTSLCPQWKNRLIEARHYAKSDHTVLLTGPSGSGKDVLARAIHQHSPRQSYPFVPINCAALHDSLVESELFGHKRGAFTGAQMDRKGAFQSAQGGTLFLDEIGDLNLGVQAKLLRALENHSIKPLGLDQDIHVDVRIIAATHKPIEKMVADGTFRADLFFRLNVINIQIPYLNERKEDIPYFIDLFSREQNLKISPHAAKILENHRWEGNIRELKNFILRAKCVSGSNELRMASVTQLLLQTQNISHFMPPKTEFTADTLQQIEKGLILERLMANNWNQRKTARDLGLPKSTLHDQLKRFGIIKLKKNLRAQN